MVDASALGATGTPFVLDVERGKIREFARATFAPVPDEDAPISPPTFLTTAFHWQSAASDPWEQVRMDPSRGLHAEQELVFHGPPPRAGDRLIGTSRIDEIYEKTNRTGKTLTFVVMVTEFRDAAGRIVAESRLTGVETS
ncbi:MAG: MaoC family dehydratase [Frankiales bacterium]|nr:MaoC family dehydratase [Frankiales bacterium]